MLGEMNATGDIAKEIAKEIDGAVFVHGGNHDKSCWQLLLPLMKIPSIAVDLPGRGDRPANGVAITYAMCAEAVLADADAAGFDRFMLIGHSMGGLTISRTALEAPERVAHLVYVGALVLPVGMTVADKFGVDIAPGQPDSAMMPVMDEQLARTMFAGDMTDDVPVPPSSAIEMIKQLGPDVDYRELDAAHNIMLSQPETLATILNELAATLRT